MSDALTDIARDERRAREYGSYIEALLDLLEGNAEEEQVVEAARRTDEVRGGYWGGGTDLSQEVRERIERLRSGDDREWGRLLDSLARDGTWTHGRYYRAKALSPWRDRMLLHVDYGCGFSTIHSPDLDAIVRRADMMAYDADDYVVIVPVKPEEPSVVWTRCGILGQDGPRPSGCKEPPTWRTEPDG